MSRSSPGGRRRGLRVAPDSLLGQALREGAAGDGPRRSGARSALLGLGIGLGVGVAAIAIAFSIIAIPLYLLASTEPGSGLDRDLVRKGLFFVALPFGVVAGTSIGVAVGVWYGRGGRLPIERSSIYGR
jgi:hypothetical protein